ncbi:hypothetical protein JW890_02710 [candidate division WOR-3 bacterium]|nr:hypothetical protein [candidate division WOR-3 bacterium]
MALGRKKELFFSFAVLFPCLIIFFLAFFYRNAHRDPGWLTCCFENVDSADLVSMSIKSNYFDVAILRTTVPPPSITVDLKNLVPGTLEVRYHSRGDDSEKKLLVSIIIGGEELEKRELIPSSQMLIPLE